MALFKDMLSSGETLFRNEVALDYSFVPKLLPYREKEQHHIANCIKPIFNGRNGKNLLIHGAPGIGKTAAIKWIFRDLEDETDEIIPIYINCWQKNTTYKIFIDICDQLGYKFTQNKKTDELFKVIKKLINQGKGAVFAFDEVDKVEDYDFLYSLLEEIYSKTILLITNYKVWLSNLDERIRSRLTPEVLEFPQYNKAETGGIMKQRLSSAFIPDVFNDDALEMIIDRTYDLKDIRSGLYLLRESALAAEDESSRKVLMKHAEAALAKLSEYSAKDKEDIEEDTKPILDIVKEKNEVRIGDLYRIYQESGGKLPYRTFTRRIKKLEGSGFIKLEKVVGGADGSTTIIRYNDFSKKLTDF